MTSRFREFRFGWPVVVASALGIGLGMSPLPFYTIGVFVAPLSAEFGWGVDDIMKALPIFTLGALIMSPLIGLITDKLGVRRVVLFSIVSFSLAMMAMALNNGSMTLYLSLWCLLALLGAGTLPITWTRAVNNWFHERRGLALGLSLVATGFFGSTAKIYAAWLIENFGWRVAYVGVGLLPLVIVLPIAYLLFRDTDDPKVQHKVKELHAGENFVKASAAGGMSLGRAVSDWRFWLLAYAFVPISFAVGGPIPNMERLLGSKGFGTQEAVILASLIGYSVVVGRLLGGYLIDRFWAPGVAMVLLSLPAISCFLLQGTDVSFATAATAILILGLAAGVEYDLMAYLVTRYFGMGHYAAIYGTLYGFFALGAGLGPYFFGVSFTQTGSYDTILGYAAFMFLAGAVPLLLLGKYRNFKPGSAKAS